MSQNNKEKTLKTVMSEAVSTDSVSVDPSRWYTLYEIADAKFFRGYEAVQTVRRIIMADKNKKNILQTIIQGNANGRRYGIKGENIIKFLSVWETGEYQL